MNRREFLKSILSSAAIVALGGLDKIVNSTSHLSDDELVSYITIQMNLLVTNPSKCAIIEGITE